MKWKLVKLNYHIQKCKFKENSRSSSIYFTNKTQQDFMESQPNSKIIKKSRSQNNSSNPMCI
jgi:hypothetical protein